MFRLAIIIGVYSYVIFAMGLLGFLYKELIIFITLISLITGLIILKNKIRRELFWDFFLLGKSKLNYVLLALILSLIGVNLLGALGPELGFDALWYHLTLPKIFLSEHSIVHIPGGLLYYSDMPKVAEMLYVAALSLGDEIIAKLIHFSFGLLTLFAVYKFSRIFFNIQLSLIAALIFYSNLVVGWQSITAYVDLARAFFEIMALWAFVNWWKERKTVWLVESGILLGLAISVKLIALGSILIFAALIFYHFLHFREKKSKFMRNLALFIGSGFIIILPWLLFSFIHTGNPIYPAFSNIYSVDFNFGFVNILNLPDPISPLYLIFFPLIPIFFLKFSSLGKVIVLYSLLSYLVFCVTPQTGGGRFLLPYLPAASIVTVAIFQKISKIKLLKFFSFAVIILIALTSIVYRGLANAKYLPYVFGLETKDHFLTNNLNFNFGDFYDTDGYFKTHIKSSDKVLLYGFHNLYYVNFPFIDSSFVKPGDEFNFITTQDTKLPERFEFWNHVYHNPTTKVDLYYLGGAMWVY